MAGLIWEWSMQEKEHELGLDLDRGEGSIPSKATERDGKEKMAKITQALERKPLCLEYGEEHAPRSRMDQIRKDPAF